MRARETPQRRGEGRWFQQPYTKNGIKKYSRTWFIEYYQDGQRHTEKTGSTDARVAQRRLRKRLNEIEEGRFVGPQADRTTLAELKAGLLTDYRVNARKSLETAEAAWKALLAPQGEQTFFSLAMKARAITTARLREYIQARQQAGRKNATIKNELAILRRAFRLAAEDGQVAAIPKFPMPEVDNARQGFFEAHEYRAVLAELPAELRPLIIALYHTGWRTGELRRLEWSQVDFEAGILRLEVRTTKNNKGREFPFTALPELAEMLRAQWAATTALGQRQGRIIRPVFHRAGRAITSFRHAWQAAVTRAALPGRVPHDFRRTAVRNLVRAGVSEKVAMTLTGHRTRAVFDRYDIVNEADLRGAVERLAARRPDGGPGQVIPMPRVAAAASP